MQMTVPLDETNNDFAIFVGGDPLQKHVARGGLFACDKEWEPYQVVSEDIKIRINNWYKTKASLLHWSVYFAFGLGICIAFFGIGFSQWIAQRRRNSQREPQAA
jgi:hypothetical protein